MIIPRENNLVRLYIQLTEVSASSERVDRSKITPEVIFKSARNIISPYKLDYHYCDWYVSYLALVFRLLVLYSLMRVIPQVDRIPNWPKSREQVQQI